MNQFDETGRLRGGADQRGGRRAWLAASVGGVAVAACAVSVEPASERALPLGATSTSFQDGVGPTSSYGGTRDTMIEEGSPNTTNGGDTLLSVDGDDARTALLSWDLSAHIPGDARVTAAAITLTVSDRSTETFSFFEARRGWAEGQATWNRFASGASWQTAGGEGPSDRGAATLGSFSADPTGTYTVELNASGVALVQQWVSSPASNHGLFLAGPSVTNRLEFRSSESSTKSSRPKLTVTWEPGGGVVLDPTPGTYRGTCDGSAAVALDADHFLNGNDENQTLRVYRRGANAAPVQQVDVSGAIGVPTSGEADFEGAARLGNRVYVIGSHGRDKNGNLEPDRNRFFALDLTGAAPNFGFAVAGSTSALLAQLLVASNWTTPDPAVLSALQSSSQLSASTVASLAPELNGTNLEGLATLPTAARPGQLVVGFRNPLVASKAIVVSLLNADAVIGGATARFGEATLLDLGGLGVRAMTWSPPHAALLIVAGPKAGGGPFRLYKWSGEPTSPPVLVRTLSAPASSGPEAIVTYPNTNDVQIVFDQGDALIGGSPCKDASASSRAFTDVIVHVD